MIRGWRREFRREFVHRQGREFFNLAWSFGSTRNSWISHSSIDFNTKKKSTEKFTAKFTDFSEAVDFFVSEGGASQKSTVQIGVGFLGNRISHAQNSQQIHC